jgi:hypothetical protein
MFPNSQTISYTSSDKSLIQLFLHPLMPPNNPLFPGVEHQSRNAPLPAVAESLSSVVVGLSISKATATIALLGNDSAGALSGVEATAAGSAIGIRGARAGDELGSGSLLSSAALVGIATVVVIVVVGRGLETEGDSSVGIGLSISKATTSITLLGDNGTSTLSSVESTAARGASGIRLARASDELGALGGSKESQAKDSSDLGKRGHF